MNKRRMLFFFTKQTIYLNLFSILDTVQFSIYFLLDFFVEIFIKYVAAVVSSKFRGRGTFNDGGGGSTQKEKA